MPPDSNCQKIGHECELRPEFPRVRQLRTINKIPRFRYRLLFMQKAAVADMWLRAVYDARPLAGL